MLVGPRPGLRHPAEDLVLAFAGGQLLAHFEAIGPGPAVFGVDNAGFIEEALVVDYGVGYIVLGQAEELAFDSVELEQSGRDGVVVVVGVCVEIRMQIDENALFAPDSGRPVGGYDSDIGGIAGGDAGVDLGQHIRPGADGGADEKVHVGHDVFELVEGLAVYFVGFVAQVFELDAFGGCAVIGSGWGRDRLAGGEECCPADDAGGQFQEFSSFQGLGVHSVLLSGC